MFSKMCFGFFLFSGGSSIIYIYNDMQDMERDKLHPAKRNRPLASGEISLNRAKGVMGLLFFLIGILLLILQGEGYNYNIMSLDITDLNVSVDNMAIERNSAGIWYLLIYFLSNLYYSSGGKNIPLVDISILSLGYLLRVLYGGSIIVGSFVSKFWETQK
ncbi:MAG: UbiA family prenyltransferase [Lachnospiraceae bacterium]|nr:UbiA family prenyltransferase [Lachnospiraceae bacterium]